LLLRVTAFHEQYENFSLDIGLEVDNFLALNTQVTDNELFMVRAMLVVVIGQHQWIC